MSEIQKLVDEISLLTEGYQPGPATAKILKQKTAIQIIGPFGIGKSSMMHRVAEIDSEFSYVVGLTTRERRPGEPDGIYRYPGHTIESLTQIRDQLERGELVQAAVHPTTGYIYATDLDSYANTFNILDVFATEAKRFDTLPFKEVIKIYMVAPVNAWLEWLKERNDMQTPADIMKRWEEARINLELGIEFADNVRWVINHPNELEATCHEVIDIARGKVKTDPNGPELARIMLTHVEDKLTN